jgi:hypothetical protein
VLRCNVALARARRSATREHPAQTAKRPLRNASRVSLCPIGRVAGSIRRVRRDAVAVLRRALRFVRAHCDVVRSRDAAWVAYRKKPCRFAMRMHKSA